MRQLELENVKDSTCWWPGGDLRCSGTSYSWEQFLVHLVAQSPSSISTMQHQINTTIKHCAQYITANSTTRLNSLQAYIPLATHLPVWNKQSINQSSFINGMTERKPTIHKILYIALNQENMCLIYFNTGTSMYRLHFSLATISYMDVTFALLVCLWAE